jgi:ligand-binding SRPBCC domain-containing protein
VARPLTFEHAFTVRAPVERVRAFHERPDAVKTLTPGPGRLTRSPPVAEGAVVRFTLFAPWPVRCVGRYENVTAHGFDDVMLEGPFRAWRHQHRYHERAPGVTEVRDRIEAELARLLRACFGARPGFAYRAWATRRACER